MDISKVLQQLRRDLANLDAAIASLERIQQKGRGRGRPQAGSAVEHGTEQVADDRAERVVLPGRQKRSPGTRRSPGAAHGSSDVGPSGEQPAPSEKK
jgi:hypothetical protein